MRSTNRLLRIAPSILVAAVALFVSPASAEPIAIADVKRDAPVDFEKDVLPIFRRNCLACHSATEAQSDLVLESPQTILKGGSEGPSVVAGKSAESLLLKLAALQQEPFMPPPDNDVQAKPLTPEELGLIKLWIDEGAKGEVKLASGPINWQPLPPGVNPVFAVAISPDGQYAAAGRANQIFLYHVPSKRELGRLTDPSLIERGIYKQPGVADLDLIQSLTFSPGGDLLASGGYRTIKLWRKPARGKKLDLAGLEGAARSIAVSNDGKFAAIGEETGKVKVYDLSNGQVAKTLQGHTGPVTGVAFTADGTKLVSASQDKTFRIFNLADGMQIASVETPAPVNAVAVVTDGTQVATGGADNSLRIWALPTAPPAEGAEAPKPVKEIGGHGGQVNSLVALAPNGAQVLTGCQDGVIRVIDIASGNAVKQMNHGAPVVSVAIRSDGKRIASASANNTAKIWSGENNQQVAEMKGDFRAAIKLADSQRAAALAKRQVQFAKTDLEEATKRKTAEEENQKKSVEAVTAAEGEFKKKEEAAKQPVADKEAADKALADATAAKPKADEAKKVADEAATKAAEALVAANKAKDDATKSAADAATAATAAATKLTQAKEALAKDAENQTLKDAVAAAEKEVTDAEAKKKTADEAKVAAEKVATDADTAKKTADANKVAADKAAADAATALTQADQKVKQVTPVAQKAVDEKTAAERALATAKRSVERAAESVKKATEAVPGVEQIVKSFEALVATRDMEVAAVQTAAQQSEKPLKAIAFSPNGQLVATAGDDQLLHTYDSETGAAIDVFEGAGAALNVVAFTADNNPIAAAANNTGLVWDYATEWKLERTIGNPDSSELLVDRVTALDFSPDGKLIASGGGEPSRSGEIKIWEVASGNLVRALKDPHSDTVFGLDFSPDGVQLASCGADRFVKVHNVADGAFVRAFEGHTHHVLGVAWRADGRMMASSGADAAIKVWDTRTGDQLRTIQGFTKEITGIRFVAEGDIVLVSSGDKIVRFTNAANGGNVRDFPGSADYVYASAVSADGKTIISGGADSVLRIWNENAQPVVTFEAPKPPEQTAAK
ncbi:MAG TPA: c-type cytochrome domain-containing protein [Pirellulaceae bacterium]|nr:c-type cytochrome domain-containing protein [Pirellulaceae bacterium]